MLDLLSCTTKLDETHVLYVCCSASRELRGLMEWSIPWIPSSRMFMSCVSSRVLYVSILHVEYARQGDTPFKRRMSEVGRCRMDLPGPTTSVGTRTDYSVGPWDYPACAARHMMAWSTRTTEEKYSLGKLYMSHTVWKTPRHTRLVLSPYSDL
jgi:hypothetical protein